MRARISALVAAPFIAGSLAFATGPGADLAWTDASALQKCGGGPTAEDVPEVAYLLDGALLYIGDMPGESGPDRERFDATALGSLEGVETDLELLCWNQAAALLDIEVRGAAVSIWTAPGPLDAMRATLEAIGRELDRGFEASGRYAIDPDAWPSPSPGVSLWFGVEDDEYAVSAAHPRLNRVLFIASSPDASVPGYDRPDNPSDHRGVRAFLKHPPPPLAR